MTPNDGFFNELKDWSRYKHDILLKYVHVWSIKLSSTNRRLAFIDGCAGAGRYRSGEDGSPMIASRRNDDASFARRARLDVHACEPNAETAAVLKDMMRPWTDREPPCAFVYHSGIQDALPALLRATTGVPTLVFIDPYGHEAIRADSLAPILQDGARQRVELILRVDPTLLARYAGWVNREGLPPSSERARQRFIAKLQQFNLSEDEIRDRHEEGERMPPMELLRRYVEMIEGRFAYVNLVPICPSYGAAPKYFLLHATDSPDGCALLNDAASSTYDKVYMDSMLRDAEASAQHDLLGPLQRRAAVSIADAVNGVVRILNDVGGRLSYVELRAELALEYGPDLRQKDHAKAVKQARQNGLLLVVPEGPLERGSQLVLTALGRRL